MRAGLAPVLLLTLTLTGCGVTAPRVAGRMDALSRKLQAGAPAARVRDRRG